jgi:hypothetical protein
MAPPPAECSDGCIIERAHEYGGDTAAGILGEIEFRRICASPAIVISFIKLETGALGAVFALVLHPAFGCNLLKCGLSSKLSKTNRRRKEESMFGKMVKKNMDKDPQEALNDGRKSLNKGLSGGLTKAFMGQEFVDKMNSVMDQGQAAIDMQKSGNMLAMSGMDASAEVLAIQDTGAMINMNPVVKLTLKVTPTMGMPAFETTGETMVSKIAIPRKGETIKIKYNVADPKQFVVMS